MIIIQTFHFENLKKEEDSYPSSDIDRKIRIIFVLIFDFFFYPTP